MSYITENSVTYIHMQPESARFFAGHRNERVKGTGTEMMGESPAGQIDTGNGWAIG